MKSMKTKYQISNLIYFSKNVYYNLPRCDRCSENSREFAKICLAVSSPALHIAESSRGLSSGGQIIT